MPNLIHLRGYIDLCSRASRSIVLHDLIDGRYGVRPYGWPELETILLVDRLVVLGEVRVVQNGGVVPADKLYGELTTPAKWRRLVLVQRRSVDTHLIQSTRALGKDLFSEMGPETEEALFNFLRLKLKGWETDLLSFKPLAETGSYPGKEAIADGLRTIARVLAEEESFKCIEGFNNLKKELQDLADSFQDLKHFYERQKPAWEGLRKALDRFQPNRRELDRDAKAGPALQRMGTILAAPRPYGLIKEASGLIQTVAEVNDALVAARRAEVLDAIARQSSLIDQELVAHSVDTSVKEAFLAPMQTLKRQVQEEQSLAHLAQAQGGAMGGLDDVVTRVEKALKTVVRPASPSASSAPATPPSAVRPRKVIKPADLSPKPYLESQADLDVVLAALRQQLESAVAKDERIQIR